MRNQPATHIISLNLICYLIGLFSTLHPRCWGLPHLICLTVVFHLIRGYLIFLDSISPLMKQVGMILLRDTDFSEGKDSGCLYVKFFHFVWGPINSSHILGTAGPVASPFSGWAGLEQLSTTNNRGERAMARVCVCDLWFQMWCAGNDSDIQERNNSD